MGDMKIFKTILIVGFFLLGISALKPGFEYRDFSSEIHFSSLDLKLQLEEAIHNDVNVPLFWVRFFHNKLTFFVLDVFRRWLMFWDIRFLLSYLLPTGIFGLAYGILNLLKTKKSYFLWFVSYLIFLSLTEVIFAPRFNFLLKILFLLFPLQIFSLFGWWWFLKTNKIKALFLALGLLLMTIWWQRVFSNELMNFCVK